MKNIIVAACAIIGVSWAIYSYSQPKTYEDCVLANVVDTENEQAARTVSLACRKKFPDPPNPFDQFDNMPISKN